MGGSKAVSDTILSVGVECKNRRHGAGPQDQWGPVECRAIRVFRPVYPPRSPVEHLVEEVQAAVVLLGYPDCLLGDCDDVDGGGEEFRGAVGDADFAGCV